MSRGRVDDHAGPLVDDHQVVVLIDDLQGNVLRLERRRVRLRDFDFDDVAGCYAVSGLTRLAVDGYEVALDQTRGRGTAQVRRVLGNEAVEARRRRGDDQLAGFRMR